MVCSIDLSVSCAENLALAQHALAFGRGNPQVSMETIVRFE